MRIACLVALNNETGKTKEIVSGSPSEVKAVAKQIATGEKKLKGFDSIRMFETPVRSWKVPVQTKKKETSDNGSKE